MITGADDYPFHQTAEPMAFAGTDRNFYDRFFFNGYTPDGRIFFAVALGLYPQLDIMDGAVSVLKDGRQYTMRVSRRMHADRSVLTVGPLRVDILTPLESGRISLMACDSDLTLDIRYQARHAPIEEPRFTRRIGTRAFMDYTRMTQNVVWSGTLTVDGEEIRLEPGQVFGTRDRSWGVRPVGAPDSQPPPVGNLPQFFWLWNPCNFAGHVAFSHTNDDGWGRPWNRRAGIQPIGGELQEFEQVDFRYDWHPGSRRLRALRVEMRQDQHTASVAFEPIQHFYMSALGYTHPVWGHGMDHGEYAFSSEVLDTGRCDERDPLYLHVQAIASARLTVNDEQHHGVGVVEQLFLGPHAPAGLGEGLAVDRPRA